MNTTLRCDNCDCDLKVAHDSWDDDPQLAHVIRFHPCKCVTDRLATALKVVDACHSFIDRSGCNDISIMAWIEAKLTEIRRLQNRIVALGQQVDRQNDMLGGIH